MEKQYALTESEREELEGYLKGNDYELYKRFRDDDYDWDGLCDDFTPLEFFRLYDKEATFIEENKHKPLSVVEHFKSLELDYFQSNIVSSALNNYRFVSTNDSAIKICLSEIDHYINSTMLGELDPDRQDDPDLKSEFERSQNGDGFDEVLEAVRALPDIKQKLSYLIEERTKWQRENPNYLGAVFRQSFADKCNYEIEKYRELVELGNPTSAVSPRNFDLDAECNPTEKEKLLAKLCPLFGSAWPKHQREVWSELSEFSRNQWALFLIVANPKKKDYGSITEAVDALIKPKAKLIEEINGLTNMRSVVIVEGSKQYPKDFEKVREIIQRLKASAILRGS